MVLRKMIDNIWRKFFSFTVVCFSCKKFRGELIGNILVWQLVRVSSVKAKSWENVGFSEMPLNKQTRSYGKACEMFRVRKSCILKSHSTFNVTGTKHRASGKSFHQSCSFDTQQNLGKHNGFGRSCARIVHITNSRKFDDRWGVKQNSSKMWVSPLQNLIKSQQSGSPRRRWLRARTMRRKPWYFIMPLPWLCPWTQSSFFWHQCSAVLRTN